MTVKELFNHFKTYFKRIVYKCYIDDEFGCFEDKEPEVLTNDFIENYGDHIVTDWEFLTPDNAIYLELDRVQGE